MNELVYPCDQLDPMAQVVVGMTTLDVVPPFMKHGCSIRFAVVGKPVRVAKPKRVAAVAAEPATT